MKNFETSRTRLSVLVLAALVAGGSVAAQQKPQGGGNPLLIDFTAMGADGKPVADLTPADVSIKIAGKVRTITSLDLKKVTAAAAPAAGAAPTAAAPASTEITAPFVTNEVVAAAAAPAPASAGVSRTILFLVDTESLTPGSEAGMKAAIGTLLEGLNPGDRVALSTVPRDTAQVGLGTGITRVREAVNALKGLRPSNASSGDALCRTQQTLGAMTSILSQLGSNPTPSSVVFVAAGLSTRGSGTSSSSGSCEVVDDDYKRVADTAAEARANMYVVQGDQGAQGRNDGLEQLAGVTGAGVVMRVTGDGIAPRILSESGVYWVATLAPDASDRAGQAQRLEVATTKAGVKIGARVSAVPSRVAVAGAAPAAAAAGKGGASPRDMLANQAAYTDLQLRATAWVNRGQGDKMTAFIQFEPVDPAVKLTAARVGFFDAQNKGGSVDPPQFATYPITTLLPLSPGQYRVRVAATDASGKSGALDIPVNATLVQAGPLKIGGMMTGAAQGQGNMKPQLQFTNEPNVIVFLELYGAFAPNIGVKFEVAKSDAGPALETYPPAGAQQTNEPDKAAVFAQIPIDKLEPGDYVIRVVIEVDAKPVGSSKRTIRKVAK